jgi:hypothetical protein
MAISGLVTMLVGSRLGPFLTCHCRISAGRISGHKNSETDCILSHLAIGIFALSTTAVAEDEHSSSKR